MKENDMILFENKGEIDLKAISIMGINAKENDNAIGYFGTGLKYAISVLLRNDCFIIIHSNSNKYLFKKESFELRGKSFDLVKIKANDGPWIDLGFTTELGKNWELWQAYRELYCNCLDENGEISIVHDTSIDNSVEKTFIYVIGKKFEEVHNQRENIILNKDKLQTSLLKVDIYQGGRGNNIFYRCIRVCETTKPTFLTYNVTNKIDLTEDRTAKYTFQIEDAIKESIVTCNDKNIIRDVLLANDNYYEHDLNFNYRVKLKPSDEFVNVARELRQTHGIRMNNSAIDFCDQWSINSGLGFEEYLMSNIEVSELNKAIDFCESLDFNISDYEIKIVSNLGENYYGLAKDDIIYLSKEIFKLESSFIASTLIEEYLHLKYDVLDESREFQNLLFTLIIDLGERVTGNVL